MLLDVQDWKCVRKSRTDRACNTGVCRAWPKGSKAIGGIWEILHTRSTRMQSKNGYSVVEEIGGHGIGLEFHEEPFVSYVTPKGSEMVLVPGMMFTIEPMINEGAPEFYVDEDNGWTVYTDDDGLSAQVEYMVLVKEKSVEVLTK